MATELNQRLRDMAERGEWRGADALMESARAELDPVRVGPKPERRRPPAARWRAPGWAYAIGAAALTLVLLGAAALILSESDAGIDTAGGSAATTEPGTPGEQAPAAAPGTSAASAADAGPVWSRVPGTTFDVGHTPVQAVRFGESIVAAGYTEIDVPTAAVWLSEDGAAWTSVGDFGGDTRIFDLAATDDLLVAVGTAFDDDPSGYDHAAVWTSSDGVEWTAVARDPEVFPPGSRLSAVIAGPPFLAAGQMPIEVAGEGGEGSDSVPAMWVSEDGREWRSVASSGFAAGDEIRDLAVLGPCKDGATLRYFCYLAVGRSGSTGAMWMSEDYGVWHAVEDIPLQDPLDESCPVSDLTDVAWGNVDGGDLGVVVAGQCGGDGDPGSLTPVLWTSSHGDEWVRSSHSIGDAGSGWIMDVTVTERGFRAVGGQTTGDGSPVPAVWYSADGVTWVFQQDETRVQVSAPGEPTVDVRRQEASDLPGGALAVIVEDDDRLVTIGIGTEGGFVLTSDRT